MHVVLFVVRVKVVNPVNIISTIILVYRITVSRALGIPTRSVTNFDSAHDSDGSMTIDSHFDEEGDLINHMNDSVWYVFTFSFQLSEARDRDHPIDQFRYINILAWLRGLGE